MAINKKGKDEADAEVVPVPAKRPAYSLLIGDGKETEWYSVADYVKAMKAIGGSATPQSVYARIKTGALEKGDSYGKTIVREPELKSGTRRYDLYFGTRTCP